jgi:hypothetical protein
MYRNKKRKSFKKLPKPTKEDIFLNAVARGDINEAEKYLDEGGDATVRNCKGETALHIAAAHHQNTILGILLPYFEYNLDIRNMFDEPATVTAIKYGNKAGAKIIFDYFQTNSYRQNKHVIEALPSAHIIPNNTMILQNPIMTPEGIITTVNKSSLNRFINNMQKSESNIAKKKRSKTQKYSKEKVSEKTKKELKKLESALKNRVSKKAPKSVNISKKSKSELDTVSNKSLKNIIRKYMNEYVKEYITAAAPVKLETKPRTTQPRTRKRSILKNINEIKSIGNLPEELQFIPRGTFVNKNRGPNYNNTQSKQVRISNKKEEAELRRIRRQVEKEERTREREILKEEKRDERERLKEEKRLALAR